MRNLAMALEARDTVASRVIRGSSTSGRFLAADRSEHTRAQSALLEATAGAVMSGAALVNPALNLVSGLLDLSAAAARVAESIGADPEPTAGDVLVRTLRAAAEEAPDKPLVCFIEDADALDAGWWALLQFSFAQEIHEGLPLVLVIEVTGGPDIAGQPAAGERLAIATARSLRDRGLARWAPLERISAEAMREWLGPMSDAVAEVVLEVSEGRGGIAADLWRDWRERGVIALDDSGVWHFVGSRDRILADIGDDLSRRILRAVGSEGVQSLDRVRELLACAALEGRTFSAEAVARALGRDRDEAIDCLDQLVGGDGDS